ncbi:SMI1/KNR4 family protein [Bartonella sp. HY038]|uniref:SMI1/KNR4 family protein n=1 Tax=Bartonella sp. HY038 TaxID=2759660 RepID=UPI0015F79EA9|nr:SMI1/KNR4 family protein [Bartonella sp. HY038]
MSYDLEKELDKLNKKKIKTPIVPPIPDDDLIKQYEMEIDIKFPSDYKKFIKKVGYAIYNGLDNILLSPDLNNPRALISVINDARESGLPHDWLPIVDSNADYYCIRPDGKVTFWSNNGTTDEVWNDLATWIHEVWIEGN